MLQVSNVEAWSGLSGLPQTQNTARAADLCPFQMEVAGRPECAESPRAPRRPGLRLLVQQLLQVFQAAVGDDLFEIQGLLLLVTVRFPGHLFCA